MRKIDENDGVGQLAIGRESIYLFIEYHDDVRSPARLLVVSKFCARLERVVLGQWVAGLKKDAIVCRWDSRRAWITIVPFDEDDERRKEC